MQTNFRGRDLIGDLDFSKEEVETVLDVAWDLKRKRALNEPHPYLRDKALAMLEIDENGLDEMDKRILETVIGKFGGGPVGIGSLAVAVGEEPDTLEEVYEPYLIMEGYLKRTPQGRVATELSYKKLGLKLDGGKQARLL